LVDKNEGEVPSVEAEVRVAESKPRDIGKVLIRVSPATLEKLQIRTGDIVRIRGKNRITGAIAWPCYPEDINRGTVNIDEVTRENAGVSIGDQVLISKANETAALEILLAPINIKKIAMTPQLESYLARRLTGHPLSRGDVLRVPIGIDCDIHFQIVQTKPEGILLGKRTTIFRLEEGSQGNGDTGMVSRLEPIRIYLDGYSVEVKVGAFDSVFAALK